MIIGEEFTISVDGVEFNGVDIDPKYTHQSSCSIDKRSLEYFVKIRNKAMQEIFMKEYGDKK